MGLGCRVRCWAWRTFSGAVWALAILTGWVLPVQEVALAAPATGSCEGSTSGGPTGIPTFVQTVRQGIQLLDPCGSMFGQPKNWSDIQGLIKQYGGPNAQVTTVPVTFVPDGCRSDSCKVSYPLYRFQGRQMQCGGIVFAIGSYSCRPTIYLDPNDASDGRVYKGFDDWVGNNRLPKGTAYYPKNGVIPPGGSCSATSSSQTPASNPWNTVLSVTDTVLAVVGAIVGVAAVVCLFVTAPVWLGPALLIAGVTVGLYFAIRALSDLNDRQHHQQDINPVTSAQARGDWINVAAGVLSVVAVGTNALTAVPRLANAAQVLTATANIANKAAAVTNGLAVVNGIADTALNWNGMTTQQRATSVGQNVLYTALTIASLGDHFFKSRVPVGPQVRVEPPPVPPVDPAVHQVIGEHMVTGLDQINGGGGKPTEGVYYPPNYRREFPTFWKPEYENGFANPDFWEQTSPTSWRLKPGVSASEAIQDWLKGPTIAECRTVMKALQTDALRSQVGDPAFDRQFGSPEHPLPDDERLSLSPQRSSVERYLSSTDAARSGDPADLKPGEHYYISNDSRYLMKHPGGFFQGENVVYVGTEDGVRIWSGFGVDRVSEPDLLQTLADEYNQPRDEADWLAMLRRFGPPHYDIPPKGEADIGSYYWPDNWPKEYWDRSGSFPLDITVEELLQGSNPSRNPGLSLWQGAQVDLRRWPQ